MENEIAEMERFLADGASYGADPARYRDSSARLPELKAALECAVERWAELEAYA